MSLTKIVMILPEILLLDFICLFALLGGISFFYFYFYFFIITNYMFYLLVLWNMMSIHTIVGECKCICSVVCNIHINDFCS